MAVTTEQDTTLPRIRLGGADITRAAVAVGLLVLSVALYFLIGGEQTFPAALTENFTFVEWVNQVEDWLKANWRWVTRAISGVAGGALEWLEEWLWFAPWPVVVAAMAVPALAYSGLRLALLTIGGVMIWGAFDMWDDAMTTLSMMVVSVAFCVIVGSVIGVACARSDRVEATLRPILDTMQVMPAFVYLIPAIFFFGIGPASACMAIIIYALPPMIRLTNLGLRQVPATLIEAAESYGTTRWQLLAKVQIPQAMPSILLGVNQTIMMALAVAVFATFVGGGGLGDQVWRGITKLKVGWALEGGLCIVTMAIIFDRLSQAMSAPPRTIHLAQGEMQFRLLPQSWEPAPPARWLERGIDAIWNVCATPSRVLAAMGGPWVRDHIYLVSGTLLVALILVTDAWVWEIGAYPGALEFSIRGPVDAAIDWLTVEPTFIAITKTMKAWIYLYFLRPLDLILTQLPWWYITALLAFAAWAAAGWRLALGVIAALFFCGAAGLWDLTMYTFAGTAVSVFFCLVFGLPVGIWAAQSRIVDAIVRPILDLMQTIPSFVYLIPALFFFGGSPTTAIFATVIYAIPPIIRTTALGLRQVPVEIDEVTRAFGTRPLQALWKAKLPLASPMIMLGVNQTIIMALAMQTVTPLVAGLGLGKEVYDAMNTADTGKGLAAGIAIALMAILLDRATHALMANQRGALGLG